MTGIQVALMFPASAEDESTEETVQKWCKHAGCLAKSQRQKAKRFLESNCIQYIGGTGEQLADHAFVCLPLNTQDSHIHNGGTYRKIPYRYDYNATSYEMVKAPAGFWTCQCQGWSKAMGERMDKGLPTFDGVLCSHLAALFQCFAEGKFGRQKQALQVADEDFSEDEY